MPSIRSKDRELLQSEAALLPASCVFNPECNSYLLYFHQLYPVRWRPLAHHSHAGQQWVHGRQGLTL